MKRVLLCVALTVGVFSATGGIAAAAVDNLDFGDFSEPSFDGKFEVFNDNNQIANQGRRIVFSVTFQCTAGETIGIIYTVTQPATEAVGDGAAQFECTGESQEELLVATVNDDDERFSDESPVDVEGAGTTDVTNNELNLNDIDFANDQLDPFSPENP